MGQRWDPVTEVKKLVLALGVPEAIAEAIDTIVRNNVRAEAMVRSGLQASPAAQAPTIGQVAKLFHRKAVERGAIIDGLLNDPSWHMLLALVADEEIGCPVTITEICHNSGGPATTALRHLERMVQMGLVLRHDDPRDHRRAFVQLSPDTRMRVHKFIKECCVPAPVA